MNKEEINEFLKVQDSIMLKVSEIIKYKTLATNPQLIINGQTLTWSYDPNQNLIYFDRHEAGDLYEYEGFIVSSLGTKGVDLFMGESDGLTYIMLYAESENWDDSFVIILDNKNKVTYDDDDIE